MIRLLIESLSAKTRHALRQLAWILPLVVIMSLLTSSAQAAMLQPVAAPLAPDDQPDSVFGVELSPIDVTGGLVQITATQTDWVRGAEVNWALVEPTQGTYVWSALASAASELETAYFAGREPVLLVRGVPAWASASGFECGPIDPLYYANFADFIYELIINSGYDVFGWVQYWSIWNEPDIDPDSLGSPADSALGCWGDDTDNFYGGEAFGIMLNEVYPALKAANPQAQLIAGELLLDCPGHPINCVPGRFLNGILNTSSAFDGISFHGYDYYSSTLGMFYNPNWTDINNYNAPVLVSKSQYIRNLLDGAGLTDKYILNTETALLSDGASNADLELTKAYYVAQSYASAIANNLVTNIWYDVTGTWGRNNGLLDRNTLAELPAYDAYQFAAGKLQAAILVQPVTTYPGVGGYAFRNVACTGGDCQVWVLWSLDGVPHDVTLPAIPLRVQDVDGDDQGTLQTQSIGLEPYYIEMSATDDQGPLTSNVAADPNPVDFGQTYILTATIDDSTTGSSLIDWAEYSLDGGATRTYMLAQDGAFDQQSEVVTADISASPTAGDYSICVRGADTSGNTGSWDCTLTLTVSDNQGPLTSNVIANPNPVNFGQSLTITANLSDSSRGGSDITSAQYSINGGEWVEMEAQDGVFNGVNEAVIAPGDSTSAPGIHGNYNLCVRGQDSNGNIGAQTCITLVVVDNTGPVASTVLAVPNPADFNQPMTISAVIDDTAFGSSNIASAQYSLDGGTTWWLMSASDGTFDNVIEPVTVSTSAPPMQGNYSMCVRGTDYSGNTGSQNCITLVVDDNAGPLVTDLTADPFTVAMNEPFTITATIDDATTGGSDILSADYSLDGGVWTEMVPQDGGFDQVTEVVTATATAPPAQGDYDLCVQGQDASLNTGSDCTILAVYSNMGPRTSDVVAVPNPATINQELTITAMISDTYTGGLPIQWAEFTLDGGATWTRMLAVNDPFDNVIEAVISPDNSAYARSTQGSYDLCVRGADTNGDIGPQTCITLVVEDNTGPETTNLIADPNPVDFGRTITITASISDTLTGGSTIASAQYSLDGGPWTAMSALDASFDQVTEVVTATASAPDIVGDYSLCVRGQDSSLNTGGQTCLTLVVDDNIGPVASGVAADPNPVDLGQPLSISATINDSYSGGSNIASAQYSLDGGSTWSPMSPQDGAFNQISEAVTASTSAPTSGGSYNLCVRGQDSSGNTGGPECTNFIVNEDNTNYVRLPLMYQDAFDRNLPSNGDFEAGFSYWTRRDDIIPVSSVTSAPVNPVLGSPDNAIPIETNSALLGKVDYPCSANGLPYGPDVYAGLDQAVTLPLKSNVLLEFKYIIYSQDASTGDQYDRFEVYVNDQLVFHDGNQVNSGLDCDVWWRVPSPQNPGNNGEVSGWATGTVNLSAYAGQTVRLSFRNYSRFDGWYNTYTYLDDVAILILD